MLRYAKPELANFADSTDRYEIVYIYAPIYTQRERNLK
jgi:hypothetical protein